MQILHHCFVGLFAFVVLFLEDLRGRARIAGKEEQEVILQVIQSLFRDFQRPGLDLSVGHEFETGDAAVGRNVLVLFSNRFAQFFQLNVTGLLGEFSWMNKILTQRVQGLEQRRGKTT